MIHDVLRPILGRAEIFVAKPLLNAIAVVLLGFFSSFGAAEEAPVTQEQATQTQRELMSRLAQLQRVVVAEPFVNIHTGAGRGFPVFHIVEQNQSLWVIKRKYNWFHVLTEKGKEGWINFDAMLLTKNPDGSPVEFVSYNERDFAERDMEFGFRTGDFGGANVIAVAGAWQFTQNLAAELVVGQGIGDFSEVRQTTVNVTNSPFPEWRYSPYFGIGGGVVKVNPSAALVQEVDRSDETAFVLGGVKSYISDKFLFRVEYRNYMILTTQETNERIEEWTIGFSVFF